MQGDGDDCVRGCGGDSKIALRVFDGALERRLRSRGSEAVGSEWFAAGDGPVVAGYQNAEWGELHSCL